ncbi:MAG: RNA methyltransferase [Clostridia bacterium]|nr:RNA methyltransferase [Clostridia bacterium]
MLKEDIKFSDSLVFEGMTSIRAIIKGIDSGVNDRRIEKIFFDAERKPKIGKDLGYLRAVSDKYGFEIVESCAEEIDKMTLGSSHGGLVAICSDRVLPSLSTLDDAALTGAYAMIEGIEDPYNFGYALRSLYACGFEGIILGERNWMSAAGVVCRSSAGASEMFRIYRSDELDAVKLFKRCGFSIVCADERTDNVLGDCALPCPLLLIVGGEKRGISRAVLDLADIRVRIPYAREFRASLSAASATTMFAFEIMRQNSKNK